MPEREIAGRKTRSGCKIPLRYLSLFAVNIPGEHYMEEELYEALRAISSTIGKCEKVLPKLREGTSQHTLTVRRIKALQIAVTLITRELENIYGKEAP